MFLTHSVLIKSLKINNLRNIKDALIEPVPELNIFHGDNGAGKTSVIESLVLLSKGKTFRNGHLGAIIGSDAPVSRVFAEILGPRGETHRLGLERGAEHWTGRKDGKDVNRISDLTVHLPFVLIEPNSHAVVSGPPETRRRLIDWGVFHVKHDHLETWRRYTRALRQRNAALRQGGADVAEALEAQLGTLGERLTRHREACVRELAELMKLTLAELSPGLPPLAISYTKGWGDGALREALAAARTQDLERGSTYAGPHRADLRLRMNGRSARDHLSRGEQKLVSAAVLLAQARNMCRNDVRPMLFLDDIASEFDERHLGTILSAARQLQCQTWITGTDPDKLLRASAGESRMFHVKQGTISAA